MPAGEHGHEQFLDDLPLPDDHAAELGGDGAIGVVESLNGLKIVVGGHGEEMMNDE